jgi:hypothetical protein
MPNPPTVRIVSITPAFLKSLITAGTGTVIVPEPSTATRDRNIPAIRFNNNDTKKQFVSIWKRPTGGGAITDDLLVFGKQWAIDPKSSMEVGPILLPNGLEIAAAIVTAPAAAADDDKVNYEPEVWESDFT